MVIGVGIPTFPRRGSWKARPCLQLSGWKEFIIITLPQTICNPRQFGI